MQVTLIRLFAMMHQAESLVAKANYFSLLPAQWTHYQVGLYHSCEKP